MNSFRHSVPRKAVRQHFYPSVGLRSSRPTSSQRSFATERSSPQAKSPRWLLVSIGLGLPITFYLWQNGDVKKPSTMAPAREPRGANQEYIQGAEGNEMIGQNGNSETFDRDEPRGMGPPDGPGSISLKQEGLDNGDTMNPFVNDPGKSKKGEGETDSVKVKGTVRVDRRQV
ncbi:hypothetical protein PENCOP_c001G02210 [Penicillium coprophilum]|uniref:Uncharacterized protein n=1 Tax=Penicillium coprophilum TaxID=36646 RepID=A0A1V6V691_9EURO|nr:hypothetical protein PENCOP_c001G02210 [Penicillium coprophilum]